jgi:gentisate 1,2-dioxygenase
MAKPASSPPSRAPADRAAFYERIAEHNLAPLWEVLDELVTHEPASPAVPTLWDYDNTVRPRLFEAGGLITAAEAERRVLILENPGLPGQSAATRSLYAGVQLILPGEIASAHRHTQSAIRFVLESRGGYTTVEGERVLMAPGDFVTTPAWTWHDHGNETSEPLVWVDVLDVQLVTLLDASFSERAAEARQSAPSSSGANDARYGANMLPVDWSPARPASPVFSYPYARARAALAEMARNGAPDACHGWKFRYIDPATGDFALPTIAAFIQLLPKGFRSAPYRCTDGAVYVVAEGEGETRVEDQVLAWKPRDIFVVPSWARHTHRASSEAVLFSASDRSAQLKLGLWREERGDR